MKSKTALTALVIAILASNEVALAQGRGNSDRDERGRGEQRDRGGPPGQRDRNDGGPERRDFDGRNDNRRDGPGRGDYGRRGDQRGAGPNHSYYRGDRLPPQYRHRQYVVDDWRGHQLSAPPRGYQWVQNGADYLLVGIATGMILQIFLSR
jgi:Ni/Co efflux regulator RcnB